MTSPGAVTDQVLEEEEEEEQQQQQKWIIKYVPFGSAVESSFWVRYCREKLDTIRLNEEPIPIIVSYATPTTTNSNSVPVSSLDLPKLQVIESSLQISQHQQKSFITTDGTNENQEHYKNDIIATIQAPRMNRINVSGSLLGYNTIEAFQKVDKNVLLRDFFMPTFFQQQQEQDDDYCCSSYLNRVILITYPDLKNHTVVYWFGIPSLVPKNSSIYGIGPCRSIRSTKSSGWNVESYTTFINAYEKLCTDSQSNIPFFVYDKKNKCCYTLSSTSTYMKLIQQYTTTMSFIDNLLFVFVDPVGIGRGRHDESSNECNTIEQQQQQQQPMMGWPLRNLVAYLSFHWNLGSKIVSILSYRTQRFLSTNLEQDDSSVLLNVLVPTKEQYGWVDSTATTTTTSSCDTPTTTTITSTLSPEHDKYQNYKVVGWELNARSKPGPRSVNLRPLLDTTHLAIQAADLNLKLMKWRMIPSLDVEKLQSCKVLLLGSGTLGCSVARTLLGWGIRSLTFVDYGTVSYSNPVRQNLFTLDDCHANNGTGKQKALAAADAVRTIAADVNSVGVHLSIPMPGHPSSGANNIASMRDVVDKLDALIQDADVIYLLTDTRESRWLPTVIAAAHNKLLINAALGLDSWLVMRHGGGIVQNDSNRKRYGCYFCNDVVAPENSMKNRTIDQQCTVTRPGLAPIASSMAVEIMVSLLHHPLYINAPAPSSTVSTNFSPTTTGSEGNSSSSTSSPLGVIPHQIRGSLVTYTMMIPTVPAFHCCTACAVPVINSYCSNKYELVQNVCESIDGSQYLEQLSGLSQFRQDAADTMNEFIDNEDVNFDDEDDF